MSHRQQGYITKQRIKLKDGTMWVSPNYTIMYRVGTKLKKETVGPSKKEATSVLADRLKALHDGTYREIKSITFKEFAEKWMKGLGYLKPSTARSYGSTLVHSLIPAFGDYPLTSISVGDINDYVAQHQGKVKPKTLRNTLALLHKLFEDAKADSYLTVNRLREDYRAIRRPRALREEDEPEVEILTPEEVNQLLDALDPYYYPLFITAVLTGMRLGEVLGLKWGDIDWTSKQIRVRRTFYKGKFYVPKTKQSKRAIDVGDQLLDVLQGLKQSRYGEKYAPVDALVFCTKEGHPLVSGV